jgi:hypothetical protein
MPEQLTKHPEVTLQVLRSGGARCGEGLPQQILQQCPAERFCQLPGGEICIYGLPEAARMTQVSAAEWRAMFAPSAAPAPPADAAAPVMAGGLGLVAGALLAVVLMRWWRRRRH